MIKAATLQELSYHVRDARDRDDTYSQQHKAITTIGLCILESALKGGFFADVGVLTSDGYVSGCHGDWNYLMSKQDFDNYVLPVLTESGYSFSIQNNNLKLNIYS